MKWPVAIVVMALACVQIAAAACELHNPPPVTPDYPPEGPIGPQRLDAGQG